MIFATCGWNEVRFGDVSIAADILKPWELAGIGRVTFMNISDVGV
jgi:hypothetical protein